MIWVNPAVLGDDNDVPDTASGALMDIHAAGPVTGLRRLTAAQVSAVHRAMRALMTDDLSRGLPIAVRRMCDRCRRPRPAPGFVSYEAWRLCNACATLYELGRLRGQVQTVDQFLARAQRRSA